MTLKIQKKYSKVKRENREYHLLYTCSNFHPVKSGKGGLIRNGTNVYL